jgi:hypothetical protein
LEIIRFSLSSSDSFMGDLNQMWRSIEIFNIILLDIWFYGTTF